MTTLVWDQVDERRYEAGVNRGVFYPEGEPAVVWNGITSIEDGSEGSAESPSYVDGVKYFTRATSRSYQAKLTAFSAPPEFLLYAGQKAPIPGFILFNQPKKRFNFSYQTGTSDGYKIHLVYNVLATPLVRNYTSVGEDLDPAKLSWQLDGVPVSLDGFRPSAHFVVDSVEAPALMLSELEDLLYGTVSTDPEFPTITELETLFEVTP